jgi:hypothetical protein
MTRPHQERQRDASAYPVFFVLGGDRRLRWSTWETGSGRRNKCRESGLGKWAEQASRLGEILGPFQFHATGRVGLKPHPRKMAEWA